jgi:hypothetical protein
LPPDSNRPRLQSKRFQDAPNLEGCLLDSSEAQALVGVDVEDHAVRQIGALAQASPDV